MDTEDWKLCRRGNDGGNHEQEQVRNSRRGQGDGDGGGVVKENYPEERARQARREFDCQSRSPSLR